MPASQEQISRVQLLFGDIWYNVGYLVNRNEITRFESTAEYWNLPDRPVLGQIFEENGASWHPSQRVAVPTWFSHLLPEGYLRSAVSSALEVSPLREYPLLIRLGEEDLPGAVRVAPHSEEREFAEYDETIE